MFSGAGYLSQPGYTLLTAPIDRAIDRQDQLSPAPSTRCTLCTLCGF